MSSEGAVPHAAQTHLEREGKSSGHSWTSKATPDYKGQQGSLDRYIRLTTTD